MLNRVLVMAGRKEGPSTGGWQNVLKLIIKSNAPHTQAFVLEKNPITSPPALWRWHDELSSNLFGPLLCINLGNKQTTTRSEWFRASMWRSKYIEHTYARVWIFGSMMMSLLLLEVYCFWKIFFTYYNPNPETPSDLFYNIFGRKGSLGIETGNEDVELMLQVVRAFLQTNLTENFHRCTVHSDIHTVHSPIDAHLLKFWLQFTLKLDGSYVFRSATITRELAIEPG